MSWTFRKLQKISGSFLVSLPKKWVDNLGLNKNSTMGIKIHDDGSLSIFPKSEEEEVQNQLVLDSFKYISRDIVKNLFSGVERITIKSDKLIEPRIKKEIRWFIRELPNIEIVEDNPQRVVIQNFGFKKIPTNKIIERLLYILSDIFINIKHDARDELRDNITQLRRFYFLLVIHVRTFLRMGVYNAKIKDLTPLKAMDNRTFCEQIAHIGTILRNFEYSEQIADFYEKVELYYKKVMDAYFKTDAQLAHEVWFDKDKLVEEAKELIGTLGADEKDKIKDLRMIIRHCKSMAALI